MNCIYCTRPLTETGHLLRGDFVIEHGEGWHTMCEGLDNLRRRIEERTRFEDNLINATIDWVKDHQHYGDIPALSSTDRQGIVADALRRSRQ